MSENTSVGVSNFDDLINKIKETSVNAVKLTDNIEATSKIEVSKSLTLDLNGQTLTLSGFNRIEVGVGGDLTITDSSTTSVGKIDYTVASDENSAIKVAGTDASNLAKLTLEKCEIAVNENNKLNGYGVYAAGYCEVISGKAGASNEDVKITAGYSAISGNGTNPEVTLTINSGTYESKNSAAIYFPCAGELTVTGGDFTGKTGFDIRAGTIEIKNAKITANGLYTDIANSSKPSKIDIPTVWGMGIAIIDHPSYSENTPISVTLSNLTFTGTSVCDLYIGNFNQKAGEDAGKFDESNLDKTFTVNKEIKVTVTDVLQYSVTKSANETSGYLIVNDLNTSNRTFTASNLFDKGDATVENKGTIVVNDLNGLINAAAIGGKIQLAADIEIKGMNGALELINGTTLDLNGHTITIEQIGKAANEFTSGSKTDDLPVNANRIVTADGATVIIKNGIINYTEKSEETGTEKTKSPLRVGIGSKESKLTLENVSISSTEYGIGVFKKGTLEVKNSDNNTIHGYVSAVTTNGSANSSPLTSDGAKIKLSGGKYTSTSAATIYFPGGETLDVVGGTFEGPTGFDIRAGTVNIKDATVKATGNTETTSKFSAANGPSGWGMGIAVFDHSSYAKNSEINITIDNVTFDCTTCNIFVGKHPGDGKSGDVSFSDTRTFNPNHKINITINDIDFTTKGLYINGANNVTITGCTFTNISESPISTTNANLYSNAIYLLNCKGNIIIGGADKADGNTISAANASKPMRGIYLDYCGASENSSLLIQNNTISDVNFNAVQITNVSFSNITISDNTISNWDADAGSNEQPENYEGGRAIRMKLSNIEANVTIENNIFINSYASNAEFKPSLSKNNITGYDDGNILKMTILDTSKVNLLKINNNVLALGNITNYDNYNMFKFEDSVKQIIDTYKVVIFNPNGGYYYTSSEPGVVCSIVVANDTVTEPTDPSRSGSYSLNGWYDAATGGKEWDFTTGKITADTTLYANWTYTGGSGGVPVTPPEEPVVKEEEIENEDGTISSITETTVTKENDDGSKETIVEKEEVVKDKDGNVQSVIEEKQSEVVNKDGSTNKTSEKVVKDKDGKVIEEKTEIEIEDKNTGVSTSVEVTKGSDGKTASEIKTQTSVETKDGKAQVDSKTLDEALKQAEEAKKAAEEKGAKDAKPVIEINAENSEDFTETEISAEDLSKLAEAEVDVKIKTTTGEINLPPEVSKNLSSNADEKVSLSFGEADKEQLTEDQKKTVGDAPVFEFNLKSGEKDIHDLGGTVSVTVPYELKAGEDPNKITVWYIDESGKPIAMNSVYDPETKSITFETSHFSYYFIAEDVSIPDDNKDDSNNNTIYYAVAAVIVILIIIALAYYFMKKKQ